MKILFDHAAGKVSHMDFYYSPCYAHIEDGEEEEALSSGWLPNEWSKREVGKPQQWFQSRVVRIALMEWNLHRDINKDVELKQKNMDIEIGYLEGGNTFDVNEMKRVFDIYARVKGFAAPLSWERILQNNPHQLRLHTFKKDGELIAWTLQREITRQTTISLQFAWTYHDMTREIGHLSQLYEMLMAYDKGVEYLNLCSGYERGSVWKSRIDGFRWWTGSRWSQDKKLFRQLCDLDSHAITIHDCIASHEKMQEGGEAHAVTA